MNNNYYLPRKKLLAATKQFIAGSDPNEIDIDSYIEDFRNHNLKPKDNTHVINFESHLSAVHDIAGGFLKTNTHHSPFEIDTGKLSMTDELLRTFIGSDYGDKEKRLKLLEILLWLYKKDKIEIVELSSPHNAIIKVTDPGYFKADFEDIKPASNEPIGRDEKIRKITITQTKDDYLSIILNEEFENDPIKIKLKSEGSSENLLKMAQNDYTDFDQACYDYYNSSRNKIFKNTRYPKQKIISKSEEGMSFVPNVELIDKKEFDIRQKEV